MVSLLSYAFKFRFYFGDFTIMASFSIPMQLRSFLIEAIIVEPTPANGSRTQLLLLVKAKTQRSTSSTGNWQGCSVFSGWFDLTFGTFHISLSQSSTTIFQISEGFFPSGFPEGFPLLGPLKCNLPGYFAGILTASRLKM